MMRQMALVRLCQVAYAWPMSYLKSRATQRTMSQRILWPTAAFIMGAGFLTFLYFGIVSLAEGPQHALGLFGEDRWFVLPIILGFGLQSALYIILKKQLFIPVTQTAHSGAMTGVSGSVSTTAMVACCIHHLTDVLPILGLTAAAAFLAEYRTVFMVIGLGMTFLGIGVMLTILFKERRKAMQLFASMPEAI